MQKYTKTAMLLHWLVALLIIGNFLLGLTMVDIPGLTPTKLKYFAWHKWAGVTVLAVACVRLLWRRVHPAPAYLPGMPAWQEKIASALHILLYLLFFAVPLSGYFYTTAAGIPVVYLGVFQIPALFEPDQGLKALFKTVHFLLNRVMVCAVFLHVAAALKHHFIDRDDTLKRMLP
jgi:cytochrome b561